jgi:hypothetical protein
MVAFRTGVIRNRRVKLLSTCNVNMNRAALTLACCPKSHSQHHSFTGSLLECGREAQYVGQVRSKSESFSTKPIPSGGGVVRNMVATPDRQLYLACSGVNKVAVVDLNR